MKNQESQKENQGKKITKPKGAWDPKPHTTGPEWSLSRAANLIPASFKQIDTIFVQDSHCP